MPVPSTGLVLRELSVGYARRRGERRVLEGLDAVASPGELTALIGPNGSGKSTLLRTLARLQPALAGQVLLDGTDLAAVPAADLARRLAVVLTDRDVPALLTARELVALGRHPHTGVSGRLTPADHDRVAWALSAVRAAHLADRPVTELSDGERQRVLVGRALAQEPAALLLDEPTAFLDIPSKAALMGLLHRLARERALVVVVATHDLELALRIADHLWLIDKALHSGSPEQLTLDGAIPAAFDGEDLTFDEAAGVFVLQGAAAGTARIDATGSRRPLLERALIRQGWRPAEADADLAVTWDGDTYELAFAGDRTRAATLADLTELARGAATRMAAGRPALRPATSASAATTLAAITPLSDYFAVETGAPDGRWRPLTELIGQPGVLEPQIVTVADKLNTTELRVAASILHLGLAARLWSPAIGALAAGDLLLDLDPERTWWRPNESGPLSLRVPAPAAWRTDDPEEAVAHLHRVITTGLLQPLAETIGRIVGLAPRLLAGNVASALAGAVRVVTLKHPEHAAAIDIGRRLLGHASLRGAGDLAEPASGRPFFTRRSCCLYYRVPGGGKCGDCALLNRR